MVIIFSILLSLLLLLFTLFEKVTTMLALTIYMVLVVEHLPFTDSTPFLMRVILMLACFAYGACLPSFGYPCNTHLAPI